MRQVRLVLLVDNGGILEVTICVTCDSNGFFSFCIAVTRYEERAGVWCGHASDFN